MATDKGQGKRPTPAEGSRRLPQGVFQPFPKIPATPTWVQKKKKKKKLAWPQGNALATLKIIIRRRQRKGFPGSHQGIREVSFSLSVLLHLNRCSRTKVKFT